MKYFSLFILLSISLVSMLSAQQNIGIGTTSPDSSAILDITSADKGILVPRMSAADRQNINNPAMGLMVFDTTINAFYYFNGIGWLEMLAGSVKVLADSDNDTKIQLEESADEDVIRFDVEGVEVAAFDGQTFHLESPGNSLMIGRDAGVNDNGFDHENVFIGPEAGTTNTEGEQNTGLGTRAMELNLNGDQNTAVGYEALSNSTIAHENVAIGSGSLFLNSSGSQNVAVGNEAMDLNITGNRNTAIGYHADVSTVDLVNATAIGANAIVSQDSSMVLGNAAKVGIGTSAPESELHVIGNIQMEDGNEQAGHILIADSAGIMSWTDPEEIHLGTASTLSDLDGDTKIQVEKTPDEDTIRFVIKGIEFAKMDGKRFSLSDPVGNVFIGESSGIFNTDGYSNSAVGVQSLMYNTSGKYNTACGNLSLMSNTLGNNNTATGYSSLSRNTAGGNNTAMGYFSMLSNITGNNNTAYGMRSLRNNTSGDNNTAVGFFANQNNTTGSLNTALGYQAGAGVGFDSLINATAIGAFAIVNQDSSLVLGNAARVGIGTSVPGDMLHVIGHIRMEDGSQTTGYIPVSDANGRMIWTNPGTIKTDTMALIADIDGDTKIQVEESPDEDTIRFDLGGTEYFKMSAGHLEPVNTNGSVYFGEGAGQSVNLSKIGNVAIGQNALQQTGGNLNVAIGMEAMQFSNSFDVVGIGFRALRNNIGDNNTAVGVQALERNTQGSQNSAFGDNALNYNIDGLWNTAIGYSALRGNTSGNENVAVGREAGGKAQAGNGNVLIGIYSGAFIDSGNENVALGNYALGDSDHDRNVAVGYEAGTFADGDSSVFLGYQAGYNSSGSNKLYIANSDVGSTGALIYGEFDNNWLRINGRLTPTEGITDIDGDTKIQVEESADENVLRFDVAGTEVFTLTDTVSTFKGTGRDLLLIKTLNNTAETGLAFQNTGSSYTWSIHRSASSTPDLVFSGGNTPTNVDDLTERLRITKDGNVGIATDTFDYKFQVGNAGDGTEARANAWNTFSDRRWKTDFAVIKNAIEKIEAINGYYYKWKDRPDTTTQVGVIAQEIESVLPEVVSTDAQGYKSVDYSKLTALLIQGMKEQQEMIANQKNAITDLEVQVAGQQNTIESFQQQQDVMQDELKSIKSILATVVHN